MEKKTSGIKRLIKVILYITGGLIVLVLGLMLVLWIKSPGETDSITDINGETIIGSIASIETVTLGGVEQTLIIRGADTNKPVMLFLHGGPGSPEMVLMKKTNPAIENDFVMVYWEQRGAGKSYSDRVPLESINLEQLISDTKELSELLAERFGKEKIYLMGHSWGSFLGILAAHRYPELFYAYFGVGQVCHQYKGEKISFEWVKEQATKHNDVDATEMLSEMQFPDSLATSGEWLDFLFVEREYVMKYGGGVTREMRSIWPIVKMLMNAKEYTLGEKMNYLTASTISMQQLWPEVIKTNLFQEIDSMQVPVYIVQGAYDYQTPSSLARAFYDQLKAPDKAYFNFESSAHSPMMEEVEKFNSIVRDRAQNTK